MKKISKNQRFSRIMAKRHLTESEICDILSFLKPNSKLPKETAEELIENHKREIREQLEEIEIYPSKIPELREMIQEDFEESLVEAGESVGVIKAQAIGKEQTQSNLNTFHTAGSSENAKINVVSTFGELLSCSKNPKNPNCMVYFNSGNSTIPELRKTIGHHITEITMKSITKSFEICIDKEKELWYRAFDLLYPDLQSEFDLKNCIIIQVDMDRLYTFKITLKQVAEIIQSTYSDVFVMFSPDCFGELHIYINTTNITLPENRVSYVDSDNAPEIYLEEVVWPILSTKLIYGLEGIKEFYFLKDGDSWMIQTLGSNFQDLLALPFVDMTKTRTSNLWDIYDTLGVEAARQFLIDEFLKIMGGINIAHPTLLSDKMTFTGIPMSISRYTMRKEESATFQQISFEETLDNFMTSATFGQLEPMLGVSASIICGKRSRIGSGMCDVKMDISKIMGMATIPEDSSETVSSPYDDDDVMPDDSDSEMED